MKLTKNMLDDIHEGLEELNNALSGRFSVETAVLTFMVGDDIRVTATYASFGDWDLELDDGLKSEQNAQLHAARRAKK